MIYIHCRDVQYMRDLLDRAWFLTAFVRSFYDRGGTAIAEEGEPELREDNKKLEQEVIVTRFSDVREPAIHVPAVSESDASRGMSAPITHRGALIINADDWGRDKETTDKTMDCLRRGTVSSASGMVFMEDSERAAKIAVEDGIDVGLHLNFTLPFSDPRASKQLCDHQAAVMRFLTGSRYSQLLFHPWLKKSFEYVVSCQIDEHRRLYGSEPRRIDGHHHKHLCTNVLLSGLIPTGTIVRRNFTFGPREKNFCNRYYRELVDRRIAKRHSCTDYFFSLAPLEPLDRLRKMFGMARHHVVEIETHPINQREYEFLTSDAVLTCAGDIPIAPHFRI